MATIQAFGLLNSGTFNANVIDNNGDPNTVLDAAQNFTIRCDWQLSSILASFLSGNFELAAYVESIGPGREQQVGTPPNLTVTVPITGVANYGPIDVVVPANTLPDQNALVAGESGTYKLVTVLSHRNSFGNLSDVSAFVEGPLLRIS
jgi:hypothetical protein